MSLDFDADVARAIRAKNMPAASDGRPSRIEELNAKIAGQDRLHGELDELIANFEDDGGDDDRKFIEIRADEAMLRARQDKDALVRALALEQPATLREVLIFILRAIDPVQTALDLAPGNNANPAEVEDGRVGSYLLRGGHSCPRGA
ncbi:MAG: hypothetical protein WBX25_34315 [Rhodomicrobium sp.]